MFFSPSLYVSPSLSVSLYQSPLLVRLFLYICLFVRLDCLGIFLHSPYVGYLCIDDILLCMVCLCFFFWGGARSSS